MNGSPPAATRPLPRSLDPLPDESLPGYLLRLAHRLDLTPARLAFLTGLSATPGALTRTPRALMVRLDPATADAFARATRLTPQEVSGLCLDATTRDHHPPAQRRGRPPRPDPWLFTTATRYCPRCLAGDGTEIQQRHAGAWRRSWRLPVVFACPEHRAMLRHRCPACHQPVLYCPPGTLTRLLPRMHDATLHPAQCRTALTRAATREAACSARLDQPAADPEQVPEELLTFQHRILAMLGPPHHDAPATAAGTPPERYFADLRLVTELIRLSWPQGRPLAASPALADAIHREWTRQREQTATTRSPGSHARRPRWYEAPPLDAHACAALLHTADTILRSDPAVLPDQLHPLIEATRSRAGRPGRASMWGTRFLRAESHCSDTLRHAVTPLLRAYRRAGNRPHATRAPERQARFGLQHIPAFLPEDWYDRHFRHMGTADVNLKLLRRTAAVRLVQIVAGGSLGDAAAFLDINPAGTQYKTANDVYRWTRGRADRRAFDAALHALADDLDTSPHLVNYQRRRDTLRGWCLDTDTWQEITSRLPPTPGPFPPDLGDRKRQCASEVVWTRVTQGEHLFAPRPIEDRQPPDTRRDWTQRRNTTWHQFQTSRPLRHYADLKHLLDHHADRLARHIDDGTACGIV